MLKKISFITASDMEQVFSAIDNFKSENAVLLAGGTDLVPAIRSGAIQPDCLIDISNAGLNYISSSGTEIKIGAMATFRAIGRDRTIQQRLPVLVNASNQVGAVQTRSLATIGGNICTAVPSADSAASLLVLDAKLCLVSAANKRIVPIESFFTGPRKTVLNKYEVLTEIVIPLVNDRKASFIKIGRRKALSLSIVNAAASMLLDEYGNMQEVRIALGAVAPTPLRIYKAEKYLSGKRPSEELFEQAGRIAKEEVKPISDLRASEEYRRLLTEVLVKRCLNDAYSQFRT